uniref:Uncharacterized protein n=1 Tax=Parascaris equorum TaxID=6256 RepID=A0A914S078_PAREQ
MRLYVTNAIRSATPAVDFAFVQYNCDSVILTGCGLLITASLMPNEY